MNLYNKIQNLRVHEGLDLNSYVWIEVYPHDLSGTLYGIDTTLWGTISTIIEQL